MDKQKPTKTTASRTTMMITTNNNRAAAVLSRPVQRVLQNFLLVWLDANINESNEDYKKLLQQLRRIVASVTTFTDAQKCVDFLSEIKREKVFMIVSGSLGQHVVPKIEAWPQLESVYIFCSNQSVHEQWARKIDKVKGVYANIEPISEALQIDRENCDRAMISISFNGIDALFMYTQLLKDAFLEIEEDDARSIKNLVDYCRLQNHIDEVEINKVEREYYQHTPIWWYTAPYFICSILNRGLRLMDIDIILKIGFFVRNLHHHIDNLYHEQQSSKKTTSTFKVFRGQGLSLADFEKMKKTKGGLMSFNNFLMTSLNRKVSLDDFARPAAVKNPQTVGILFIMTIDPTVCATSSIPFVNMSNVGYFKDREAEILFTTHTVFRIDRIQQIDENHTDRLWKVNLTLTGNDNRDLNTLTVPLRKELNWATGWSRLSAILMKMGESSKAEQLYNILLENASSDEERSEYNHRLGCMYDNRGEYSKALSFYEKALHIYERIHPPNQLAWATSYNNIGNVYYNMGEYSKALSSLERSLEIRKIVLPANHSDLAASYNNIAAVYKNMGEYSEALSFYEKAHEIDRKILPPNHPQIAQYKKNIENVKKKL
ncbi:unnamed protein product [Rotaria sordida]|uniref:Tetratricopeptide repeat protein n=1 Tax=Rotaria sordida TaxID=392033 RepID=A0A814L6Y9_9BILA|nr:unnamed protein product [Rotaria sordida]CAF3738619.1 unnamed protein product [Rotaria sordida]